MKRRFWSQMRFVKSFRSLSAIWGLPIMSTSKLALLNSRTLTVSMA